MSLIDLNLNGYSIGFIVFHPEKEILYRISLMIALGYKIYVFDNSPEDSLTSHLRENESLKYITLGENVGIGRALSMICSIAHEDGYPYLLFLDQDTGISSQTLEFIKKYPKLISKSVKEKYAALVFSGHSSDNNLIKDVRLAISSGSLFNLAVLKEIGWHNEKYFVDCVDYELCLRARRYGFKIGVVGNTPDFDHVTEQPDQTIDFFGKKLLVRRYSVSRIKDALGAYLKLIVGGLFHNSFSDTFVLTRSLGLYIFGQLLARLIQGK